MLIQHFNVEADCLLARKCVQVAADRVHLARNPLRRPRLGSLEHHVFHKMRDAVQLRGLMPRTRSHPHAHCHRAHVVHVLCQNGQPIREDRPFHTTFVHHKFRRSVLRWSDRHVSARSTCVPLSRMPEHFPAAMKMLYPCLLPGRFDAIGCRIAVRASVWVAIRTNGGALLHFRLCRPGIGSDVCPAGGATAVWPFD